MTLEGNNTGYGAGFSLPIGHTYLHVTESSPESYVGAVYFENLHSVAGFVISRPVSVHRMPRK